MEESANLASIVFPLRVPFGLRVYITDLGYKMPSCVKTVEEQTNFKDIYSTPLLLNIDMPKRVRRRGAEIM